MDTFPHTPATPPAVSRDRSSSTPFDVVLKGLSHTVFWLCLVTLALIIGAAFGAFTRSLFG